MQIAELQERVKEADRATKWDLMPTSLLLCHLIEETGELAQIINRTYHDRGSETERQEALGAEMSDVLWFLIKLANRFGIDLDRPMSSLLVRMETNPPEECRGELLAGLRNLESELAAARDELDWSADPTAC